MTKRAAKTVLVFHTSVRSSWSEMLGGLYRFAHRHGWNVQVIEHEPERATIRDLLAFWRPAGVIAECGMDEKGVFRPDVFGRIPTVYLSCDLSRLKPNSLRVNHDSESLGRVAAREFLSLGLASFAYFGFKGVFWSEERARCYQDALRLNGREVSVFSRRFFESGSRKIDKGMHKAMIRWLTSLSKPCGLLAANDLLAVEAMSVCQTVGIDVPNEISVLGIDNDEIACENATPTLSSIRPNFEEAGFLAAQLLGDRLEKGRLAPEDARLLFSASGIVRRQSTRRLPRANSEISKAMEIIRLRACDGLKPHQVFSELGCSRRLAEMRFRELAGHSVQDEITAVRFRRVKELLAREDVPIDSISSRCGWKSSAQLRVYFRSVEGVSMRTWRKLNQI